VSDSAGGFESKRDVCILFVKRERKPKARGMYRSNNNGRGSTQTLDQRYMKQNLFTISYNNISKHLNTQLYNIVLSNYAQMSTLLEIACVAIWRRFSLSQRTVSVLAGFRIVGLEVWISVAGLGNVFCAVPLAVEENSGLSGFKGESIALYPLKTKAAWFAGSRPMFVIVILRLGKGIFILRCG